MHVLKSGTNTTLKASVSYGGGMSDFREYGEGVAVVSTSAAAGRLRELVTTMARQGLEASPVALTSDDGAPAVVLISVEQFTALREEFGALVTAARASRRRGEVEGGVPMTAEQIAERLGVAGDERDEP